MRIRHAGSLVLSLSVLISIPVRAEDRIPAFARKYGLTCLACHGPFPTLTPLGEAFAGNGFRLAPGEEPRDTINTGDPLLDLPRDLALAVRLDAYAQAYANGQSSVDFEAPYNLKILSGGTISKKLSYYFYFFLFERGEIGGVEDAFIQINDLGDVPLDVAVGQFQISDPMFKRELRLEYQDYAVYRTRVGLQPTDLTYDRGIMAAADFAGFTLTGEIVNGNGRGAATEERRFDNDVAKVFFGHLTRDLTSNVRLGVMGLRGRQRGTATEGAQEVDNTVWMVGADATVSAGPFELNAQYLHREDDAPLFDPRDDRVKMDGGFAELIVRPPGSRWYGVGLYNYIEADRPLLNVRLGGPANVSRYQTVTGGAGYLMRTNFRVIGEFTWDVELEEARWTLGLVTAF